MILQASWRTCRRALLISIGATIALGLGAAPAIAAVLEGAGAATLQYSAAPEETNDLRVTQTGLTVLFDDVVAITATNPACMAAGGNVSCTAIASSVIGVQLDNLDDQTTMTGVSLRTQQSGEDDDDTLRGGDGHDEFFEEPGADTISGGAGSDALLYQSGSAVSVTLDDVADDGVAGEGDNIGTDVEDVDILSSQTVNIVGSDAANVLVGDAAASTIVGGRGNDYLVGGSGNDVFSARDGYVDIVECGTGTDIAVADTFDEVVDCETVDRTVPGSSGPAPNADDRPPTLGFLAPAAGGLVPAMGAGVSLSAVDDHGIASVQLFVDGRAIGSDSAAPYAIAYLPLGVDVGANALVAIATDTVGQTATAIRPVRVSRFAPLSLSSRITPARDRRAPYRFRVSGRLSLPPGVTSAQGCANGLVSVQVTRGSATVSKSTAALRSNCAYATTMSGRTGRLRVSTRFVGNAVLEPRSAATRRARGG